MGVLSRCKQCKAATLKANYKKRGYGRTRYWNNRDSERERHLKKKYGGFTLQDYARMFAAQNGECAICKNKQERTFDVDHCHLTDKVRGLLCTSCNRMLGHGGDSAVTLRAGADYLERALCKT